MKTNENLSPAQFKARIFFYWQMLEDWLRRKWILLTLAFILVWMVTHKDVTISFSMTKGEDGKSWFSRTTSTLFYDPFEGDEAEVQNVAMLSKGKRWDELTPEQKEKRRKQQAYVKQYYRLANTEMDKHGIPSSITLAQGLLESNIGQSRLATENNNHFGIKCFSKTCAKGHCTNFNDDHHKDFFRKFPTVEESYAAHSQLLQKARYKNLYRLDKTDYKGWARGLKKAGYATDPRYAEKLIRIIEDLELYQYDI
ncbi:MAG: glucosaminidase domain-containing protein [Saprospiraceae bacterium]